jgi:hypothetical protein
MKFLADEGIDKNLVVELRNLGFEVEYAAESLSLEVWIEIYWIMHSKTTR